MNTDLPYWLALNEFTKFGPKSMSKLLAYFPDMQSAFKATQYDLIQAGISNKITEYFIYERKNINPEKILNKIHNKNITAIILTDADYPTLLKNIYDPPAVLYIKGKLPAPQSTHLAVIGSRKASPYGIQCADMLTSELSKYGIIIVSGLAYGIDETAHKATIRSGGTTIAVLGSGILNIGTARQLYISENIIKSGGAVISEFPLTMTGLKYNFPIRNRIISGMSQGTLVIEAAEKSGSLITARSALEQNRDVFAVPGSIMSPTSKGTNNLIKFGAIPVTNASDILNILDIAHIKTPIQENRKTGSTEENAILELLSKNPIHIDEIIRQTKLPQPTIASTLSIMEIKGWTKQIGGMYYVAT